MTSSSPPRQLFLPAPLHVSLATFHHHTRTSADLLIERVPPSVALYHTVFKTGAEDEHTARWNRRSWATIRFRPRIMRPLPAPTSIDLATTILGSRFSAPFFICPAGGAKLASPNHKHEGDVLLTKGAAQHGILHWACNNGGCTQREIAEARKVPGQNLFWQIYARADLVVTEGEIRQAAALGYKGFALTVDAVVAGKRERDARASIAAEEEEAGEEVEDEDEEDEDSFATGPTVGRP